MQQRVNGRLILLKEMMVLYMTSATDAFRMFSKNKKGFLTFKEFERLVYELSGYSQEKMPNKQHKQTTNQQMAMARPPPMRSPLRARRSHPHPWWRSNRSRLPWYPQPPVKSSLLNSMVKRKSTQGISFGIYPIRPTKVG